VAKTDTNLEMQPRSTFGAWIGVVLLFGVFALFVWAVMGAMPRGDTFEEKRAQARRDRLKAATEEWKPALEKYGWVDKEKGIVRVPVERAMQLSLAELAQRKPAPAGPVGPEQPGAQVTAPVTPAAGAEPKPEPSVAGTPSAVTGKDSQNAEQPAGAANPMDAPPGSQPGPSARPAGPPSSTTREFQGGALPTPEEAPPKVPPLPVPGVTPGASATATPTGTPTGGNP
jgi:hypothetical protein